MSYDQFLVGLLYINIALYRLAVDLRSMPGQERPVNLLQFLTAESTVMKPRVQSYLTAECVDRRFNCNPGEGSSIELRVGTRIPYWVTSLGEKEAFETVECKVEASTLITHRCDTEYTICLPHSLGCPVPVGMVDRPGFLLVILLKQGIDYAQTLGEMAFECAIGRLSCPRACGIRNLHAEYGVPFRVGNDKFNV